MAEKDLLGQKLGPYVVRQRLGQGGMGTVYLAHDTALDRLVALKVLDNQFARDAQLVERFQREARAAAKLNHPNIVQVYTVDIHSDPPYMVMEYVKGASVDKILATKGPMTWQQALTICGQVASALACAHEQGIIHRDIKPGNILLDANNRARVTDFGIAKVLGANTNLTAERVNVGSPAYMSPEQCGQGQLVPASDLFSLGITLFEALTGKVPYEAETYLGLIKQITQDPLPRITEAAPACPPAIEEFVEVLTAKSTGQRYANAVQVIEDLQAFREGKKPTHLSALRKRPVEALPVVAAPSVPVAESAPVPDLRKSLVDELMADTEPVRRIPRRQSAGSDFPWAMAATIVGAVLVGIAVTTLILWRQPPPPRPGDAPAAQADQRPAPAPTPPPRQPGPGEPGYVAPPGFPAAPPVPNGAPPMAGGGFPPPGGFGGPGGPPPPGSPGTPGGPPPPPMRNGLLPGQPGYGPPPPFPRGGGFNNFPPPPGQAQ